MPITPIMPITLILHLQPEWQEVHTFRKVDGWRREGKGSNTGTWTDFTIWRGINCGLMSVDIGVGKHSKGCVGVVGLGNHVIDGGVSMGSEVFIVQIPCSNVIGSDDRGISFQQHLAPLDTSVVLQDCDLNRSVCINKRNHKLPMNHQS